MGAIHFPQDELLRIRELSRYGVVYEEKEESFCDIARIAMLFTSMPLGGVSLVDDNRVWLKGRVGVELTCLVREGAFCSYAVESSEDIFVVPDTLLDPRFVHNPLVASEPHIRFYAAANLIGHRGYNLGTLWVMDTQPRQLDDKQRDAMRALAGQVVRLLEMRYQNADTRLPNRGAFVSNLQCALNQQNGSQTCRLASCARHSPNRPCLSEGRKEPCVIGCIKIHNLHLINTAYDSGTSQELMRSLTTRLGEWVGAHNMLAHLENDDIAFALFRGKQSPESQLEQLVSLLSQPIEVRRNLLHLATSVGISRFPDSGLSASSLLDQASAAASRAETTPPATVLTFFDQQIVQTVHNTEFLNSIPTNLKERRFIPYYQPQVDIASGRLIGFEALARLRSKTEGIIGPDRFVRPAEQSGLICEIDALILDQVCRDLRHWLDEGLAVVPISVNLSRLTIAAPDVLQTLRNTLEIYRIPTELIELEITESSFCEDSNLVKKRNLGMHEIGFRVSIDDFGTGVSNLSALRDLRFERLKADRLYVHGASTNVYIGGILRFIKGIGEVFKAEVICEGVEEQEDVDWISSLGCSLFQGWYFSKAVAPENIPAMLARLDQFHRSAARQCIHPQALAEILQR